MTSESSQYRLAVPVVVCLVVASAAAGFVFASAATAQVGASVLPERYELAAQWTGTGRSLYHPWGLDVGSDGIYVVAVRRGHQIMGFRGNGDGAFSWGGRGGGPDGAGAGPAQFRAPEDVAVDVGRDRVWVADTGNRRVQILARRTGEYIDQWTDVGLPRGIASGADGTVVVADAEGHRLLVFAPDGSSPRIIGGYGREAGRLDTPLGVALAPDGLVYVADSGNRRIQWLDLEGAPQGSLNLDGSVGPGGIPLDVAVHEDLTLYVAVERGLLRFRSRTNYANTIPPMLPAVPDPFPVDDNHEGIRGVTVRAGIGMAYTYAPATRSPDSITLMPERWFPDVASGSPHQRSMDDPTRLDASGSFVHALDSTGELRIFDPDGTVYDGFRSFMGGPGTDIAGLPDSAVVLDGNEVRSTWLTCFANCPETAAYQVLTENMTQRQDCRGNLEPDDLWWNRAIAAQSSSRHAVLNAGYGTVVIRQPGVETPLGVIRLTARTAAFQAYVDLAYDVGGNLLILRRDGLLRRVDPMGRALEDLALAMPPDLSAEAIDVADSGEIFVLTHNEHVLKFDASGRVLAAWSAPELAGPGRFTDVAVGPEGNVLLPDALGDRIVAFRRAAGSSELPEAAGSPCVVSTAKSASPTRLPLGATTDVTLELDVACPSDALDLVLVIEASCGMSGERLRMLRESAADFAARLQGDRRFAIVTFSNEIDVTRGGARLTLPFTGDRGLLAESLAAVNTTCLPFIDSRTVRLEEAMGLARETLTGPAARPDAAKAVVVIAPGRARRDLVMWETQELWRLGVRLYTVAVGRDQYCAGLPPDVGLLAAMASPPSGFRTAESPAELPLVLEGVARELAGTAALESVEVVDRIPANMRLVPGSVDPPAEVGTDGSLRWQLPVDAAHWSMRFTLEPLAAGTWPTNVEAVAYTRERGADRSATFPVPIVDVFVPEPTPTDPPTPTPTEIWTATPEATSTALILPTVTRQPSSTPQPKPPTVYLPYAEKRDTCVPTLRPVDVALVIDASSSMAGEKLAAARNAANAFVDVMRLPHDRAAVVSFSSDARLLHPLSGDRSALRTALLGLTTSVGTRMDLGLSEGIRAVAGAGARVEADPVVVLMTDGLPDAGTRPQVLAVAGLGRDLGVTTYAIGLGTDVDATLLKEIAGADGGYFFAPSAPDLERIYTTIARRIPCR